MLKLKGDIGEHAPDVLVFAVIKEGVNMKKRSNDKPIERGHSCTGGFCFALRKSCFF